MTNTTDCHIAVSPPFIDCPILADTKKKEMG